MIKEISVYTIICDRCGVDSSDEEEVCGWSNEDYAEEQALESDWINIDDKHYCSNCWQYDHNDNYKILD